MTEPLQNNALVTDLVPREQEHVFTKKPDTGKKSGFISLRYRFIIATSIMLLLLLTSIAIVQGMLQTRSIRGRMEKQGLATAQNLAGISVDHLVTYNYIALEKLVNQAVRTLDIVRVIIHDKEGKVAGFSKRPDLQGKALTDSESLNAVQSDIPLITIQDLEDSDSRIMDVAVPVFLKNTRNRWGTVRVGLSLDLMHQQVRQTLLSISVLGTIALIIGVLVSNWAAQRVTKPLETLVEATVKASRGNLEQEICISTRDEVEILASNFSVMIREILIQRQQLEHHLVEIQRLQQYAEKILATMTDGLLAVDMDGIITTANPAAHYILGIGGNTSVKGSHILDLFQNDHQFADYIRNSLDNPADRSQREVQLQKGDETRVLLACASVLESDQKIPRQFIFNLNDITDLKHLENEIRQGQRLADLGTLAAGMAHEIRNPLSAIKTYVALLPKKIDRPGFLDKFQRTVPREINRLNKLIEELLELSRLPKYNFNPTDLKKLLSQTIELVEEDFDRRDIICRWQIPDTLPKVMADTDQLEKVFINLMMNSAQAMPEGGSINIRVLCENNQVLLDFKDTGRGFSAETAQNIFNPFFTTKTKGTGLGLAITHKIISEHRGRISAKSREGEGCCFSIRLPASPE